MKHKLDVTHLVIEELLQEKLLAAQKKIEQLEKKIDDHNHKNDRKKPVNLFFKD
jgi:hypothetical protein